MSPGISLTVHWWRGFGPDAQQGLFWWRLRLGFVTLDIQGRDPWRLHTMLRAASQKTVDSFDAGQRSLATAHAREVNPNSGRR